MPRGEMPVVGVLETLIILGGQISLWMTKSMKFVLKFRYKL